MILQDTFSKTTDYDKGFLVKYSGFMVNYLDILLKIYPEYILIDFRSIGRPFDTSATSNKYSNIEILKKIVTNMEYNYILGMNQTRLICKASRDQ